MKNQVSKVLAVVALTLTSLCSTMAETQTKETNKVATDKIQDTDRAVQYFDDELNFKTNPYFVSKVVKDKLPNYTIIDVRSEESFAKGHIPGAINISDTKYNDFSGPEKEYPGLRKDAINLVYCYTKTCNLAIRAAKKFASLGYPVKEIVGGYELWSEGGKYPIETSK